MLYCYPTYFPEREKEKGKKKKRKRAPNNVLQRDIQHYIFYIPPHCKPREKKRIKRKDRNEIK